MWKVDIPLDTKEAAAIARRQRVEEDRKKRIFNPKERIIGKDYDALKQQIEEKRAREEEERQRREAYTQEINRQDLVAIELQRRIEQNRKEVAKDVEAYRLTQQRFEDRREFDLNDTELLKKTLPARIDDNDKRCGPASIQRFEGEDICGKERATAQAIQSRLALEAQMREKKLAENCYTKATELYDQRLREMDLRTCTLWSAEMEARRAVRFATAQYNMAMACENEQKKALEKRAQEEAKMAHILNMCNSELLTETQDACSVTGPHRVCRDRHKGFSKDKLDMIREEQQRQRMDKNQRDLAERQEEEAWNKLKRREAVAGLLLEFDLDKRRKDLRANAERTNMELAREQTLRQQYLNRILYRDTPTEDFFEQFNTTTR